MKHHAIRLVVLILSLGMMYPFVAAPPAHADNLYASIRGTVVDPTGAVVPDATLTATDLSTGLRYTTTSSKDGLFSFLQLPIGDYSVRVEKAGFKSFTAGHIHLDLDQVFSLKVAMELGATTETITVEANPAQVETTNMQLGNTVSSTTIVDTPLNGRNWTELMQLEPGVQSSSDRFGAGAYSTNGAETQQNSFLINGTDTNDIALNIPLVIPSPDSIGEFNLVTSTLNPEYGRNSGAIVNASIKSGTNQFHGDLFEFYRDTFLDAIPWFETTRALFHQNQFGGTIGGPIVKDHAFIFFSYQGTRSATPQANAFETTGNGVAPIVYSAAERTGDFSALPPLYSAANPEPATSPCGAGYTGPFGPNPLPFSIGTATAGTPWCVAFPTGVIPAADLNPLSVKLMNQYVPLPNAPGNAYDFNPLQVLSQNQYLGRVDEKISNKDAVWFYGLYETTPFTDSVPFYGADLPGFGDTNPEHYYEDTAAWTHTFSSTMLNEVRAAYLRFNFVAVEPQSTINPAAYGFTGITSNQAPAYNQIPVVNVTGLFDLGFSSDGPQPRIQNTYQVTDNFSKVWGHHTFKAGFNMDREEINNPFYNNLNGTYSFGGEGIFSTNAPGADFLLGVPDSYDQGSGSIVRARAREYYSYAQDQWQVKPNLTLTLGAGWDIETPYKNLYADGEVMSAFRSGQQSTVFPGAPVGLVFPGDKGINQYGGVNVHYDDLAPRIGFAWSPGTSHKMSVRGGVGLYYNRGEEESTLQTLANAPFSLSSAGVASFGTSPSFANPYTSVNPAGVGKIPTATTADPFPFSPPLPGSNPSFAAFEPIGFDETVQDPKLTAPRSTNYNLNVQYQVSNSTVAMLGYVGNVARHLEAAYNLNPAGVAPGVNPAAVAEGCTSDFTLGGCPSTFQYNPAVYGQIGVFATNQSSNYNSLQASINRHFSNGLQFQAAYTYSRYFDYTSNLENSAFDNPGFNVYNVAHNYGPSANDAPQRLVVSYNYVLPFYRYGHHFKMLTDDWRLSGITTFQSGFPVEVYDIGYQDLQWAYPYAYYAPPSFAQETGAPLQITHNVRNSNIGGIPNAWLNPAAFGIPAAGTIGNANRNPFYGPGLNFWDMALEKDIHFTESKYLELRFETFDTFNHANFAAPDNQAGSSAFGEVLSTQSITTNGAGRVVQIAGKIYF
jgi:Carboxypeptidase regulatory-like domain